MADKELRVHLKADDDISKAAKSAKSELDRIPDKVETTLEVDSSGLDGLTDKLGELPGALGDLSGIMSGPAGIAAGAGVAAKAAFDLAQGFADAAVEARVLADLTGATIEDASRLQAVWKTSGADLNDLNDVVLQMNGVLQTSPELAKDLGVNLADGRDVASRFVEVVGKIQSSTLGASDKAQLMSQMFGEEGVRQVAKLTASIDGPLSKAIEEVSEAQVIDEDEEQRAKDLATQTRKLNTEWQNLKMTLGEALVGPLTGQMSNMLSDLEAAKGVFSGDFWGTIFDPDGPARITAALNPAVDNLANYRAQIAASEEASSELSDTEQFLINRFGDLSDALKEAADDQRELAEATQEGVDKAVAYAAAVEGMHDAHRTAADAAFAVRDAQRDFNASIQEFADLDPEATQDEYLQALDDTAVAAGKVADEQVRLQDESLKASGATQSAANAQQVWNRSMIESARQAEGPLRDSIINYIATVNNIPPEKVSEIIADPDYATIDEATAALDTAAADRNSDIWVDALNVPPTAAAIDHAARPRHTTITVGMVAARNLVVPPGVSDVSALSATATATGPATQAAPVAVAAYAPAPIIVRAPAPTVVFNVGVMGNRFDSQRAVTKALRAHQRLNGVRE